MWSQNLLRKVSSLIWKVSNFIFWKIPHLTRNLSTLMNSSLREKLEAAMHCSVECLSNLTNSIIATRIAPSAALQDATVVSRLINVTRAGSRNECHFKGRASRGISLNFGRRRTRRREKAGTGECVGGRQTPFGVSTVVPNSAATDEFHTKCIAPQLISWKWYPVGTWPPRVDCFVWWEK